MTFHILTIFPDLFDPYLKESVIGKGIQKGAIKTKIYDLRSFTKDKHQKVDDKAYGGGPGMVLKIEPLVLALVKIFKGKKKERCLVVLLKPSGLELSNQLGNTWVKKYDHIIFLAGRYEGFDDRLGSVLKDIGVKSQELSIGPYVLTGGELPALVAMDVISRQIPGVLGKLESLEEKRHGTGVPTYTRPEVFKYKGKEYKVPKVLISGHHAEVKRWRADKGKRSS
ncbi:MAG: tRNA (guanosine(37)-N1)-methyltransferase TrmD [Candidatus Colwellbacteria bacterium]